MDEKEWEEYVKKYNYKVKVNQYPFYRRVFDFLLNPEEDILINQGGMGLGKTFATSSAIKETGNIFAGAFIATPTGAIKNEWAKELSKLKMFEKGVIWYAKGDLCIEKRANKNFDLDKCNDDCIFRHHLNADGEFKPDCRVLLEYVKGKYPLDIDDYYKHFPKDCLLPITRQGLAEEKIILGDYYGFLNSKMFNILVGIGMMTNNSVLGIDEAHLVPTRAFEYLSKSLSLELTIRKMKDEMTNDYLLNQPLIYIHVEAGLNILDKIYKNILGIAQANKVANNTEEGRYTFENFLRDYNFFKRPQDLSFELFVNHLKRVAKELYGDRKYEKQEDPYTIKFINFIERWREKYTDTKYSQQFQYYKYKKRRNEEIVLKLVCRDTSEFLSNIWSKWGKVVMISGTIPDRDYFFDMLGLKNFKTKWELPLSSYSIKENVIIFPRWNFTSGQPRKNTYEKTSPLLKEVLKIMGGRTIIYIQSMDYAPLLEGLIKSDDYEVINFCQYEDEDNGGELESVDKNKFEELKKEFLLKKEVVAIMGINGRVEGQNFLDEDKKPVDNIIIYGYPFPRKDLAWQDSLAYWTAKMNDGSKAMQYVTFRPVASKMFQAASRGKRDESHDPNIILWGDTFSKNSPGYKYNYDELKGQIIYNENELKATLAQKRAKKDLDKKDLDKKEETKGNEKDNIQ